MSSWANLQTTSLKKKEINVRSYFEPISDEYVGSTLAFLYAFSYSQRSAEPFYIRDTKGFFQPLLQSSPILHYLKESPSSGQNICLDLIQTEKTLSSMSLNTLRRNVRSVYQFNSSTQSQINRFIVNFGVDRKTFDVGIVLDVSGTPAQAIQTLKTFQKRSGKKSLSVFVMTSDMELLRQFATQGDSSWSFTSLLQKNQPSENSYQLFKTLAELQVLQRTPVLAYRFGSLTGKLLFLTADADTLSLDGLPWKPF